MTRMQTNPLVGRFDQDAGPWRPMYYQVEIDVPVTAGQSQDGSLTINNQPYIWTGLGHQIIGNTCDPEGSGLCQDGQYNIEFKDEQSNYTSGPVPAAATWGGPNQGYTLEFPFPIPFAGSKTITFRVTNRHTRVLIPAADTFRVQIVTIGIADWGKLI